MTNSVVKVVAVDVSRRRHSSTRASRGRRSRPNYTTDAVSILNFHDSSHRQIFSGGGAPTV